MDTDKVEKKETNKETVNDKEAVHEKEVSKEGQVNNKFDTTFLKTKGFLIPLGIVVILVALVLLFSWLKAPGLGLGSSDEKVKLDFYVMSQCPFGTQVEDGIAPVLKKLGKNMDALKVYRVYLKFDPANQEVKTKVRSLETVKTPEPGA